MYNYQKEIQDVFTCGVLVVGAGPAGFGAAVAAARNGASVLLIDRNAMPGGMATAGLVGPFMTCYDDDGQEQIVKGIFDELCVRTEQAGGAIHPSKVEGMTPYSSYYIRSHRHVTPFLSETLAVVMEEMLLQAGVRVMYQVQVCDALREGRRITGVVAARKEGLALFCADTYIDCTGDADVAAFAGLACWMGDRRNGNSLWESWSGAGRPGSWEYRVITAGAGISVKRGRTATGRWTGMRSAIMNCPFRTAGR